MPMKPLFWAIFGLISIPPASKAATNANDAPVVREERTAEVNGVSEVWRLEWLHPPGLICAPDDPVWFTCPCHGFEFGEEGELDLVRLRSSREVERLHLTPLFRTDGPE